MIKLKKLIKEQRYSSPGSQKRTAGTASGRNAPPEDPAASLATPVQAPTPNVKSKPSSKEDEFTQDIQNLNGPTPLKAKSPLGQAVLANTGQTPEPGEQTPDEIEKDKEEKEKEQQPQAPTTESAWSGYSTSTLKKMLANYEKELEQLNNSNLRRHPLIEPSRAESEWQIEQAIASLKKAIKEAEKHNVTEDVVGPTLAAVRNRATQLASTSTRFADLRNQLTKEFPGVNPGVLRTALASVSNKAFESIHSLSHAGNTPSTTNPPETFAVGHDEISQEELDSIDQNHDKIVKFAKAALEKKPYALAVRALERVLSSKYGVDEKHTGSVASTVMHLLGADHSPKSQIIRKVKPRVQQKFSQGSGYMPGGMPISQMGRSP